MEKKHHKSVDYFLYFDFSQMEKIESEVDEYSFPPTSSWLSNYSLGNPAKVKLNAACNKGFFISSPYKVYLIILFPTLPSSKLQPEKEKIKIRRMWNSRERRGRKEKKGTEKKKGEK